MDTCSLFAKAVSDNLPTKYIGQRVVCYPFRDSTMRAALQEIQAGAPAGTLVIAETQIGGHGRLGRKWLSPKGNLAFSLILFPALADLPFLVMVTALATAEAVEAITGLKPDLKWPNDLLLHDKKICGMLVESGTQGNDVCHAVVGVGLNVNMRVGDYSEISAIATSLSDELGRPVARLALMREFLVRFERFYEMLGNSQTVFAAWKKRLTTLGKMITVSQGGEMLTGLAEDVADDGSLLLRLGDGSLQKCPAGDITIGNTPGR